MNGIISFKEIENYVYGRKNNLTNLATFGSWMQNFDQNLFLKFVETYKYVLNQPKAWKENTITDFLIRDIMSSLQSNSIRYNVFKADGKYETNFGDIAFIIRFHYPNRDSFEGVGFIEAKRDYPDYNFQFHELKITQMDRFLENTKSSFYCFYSHKAFFPLVHTEYLHKHIKKLRIPNANQLNYPLLTHFIKPVTFQHQLNRFINGYDLDYGEKPKNIAYGYDENFSPKFIIEINNFGENMTPTPTPSNVNPNKYRKYELSSEKEENEIENDLFKEIDDDNDDDIDIPYVLNN